MPPRKGRRDWGTVRTLESGRHQARYTDVDGRQRVAPQTFATKTEALNWLAALRTDRNRGQFHDPHAGVITLQTYAERWVASRMVRGRPLAPRTAELYRAYLRLHIDPILGGYQLRQLTTTVIREWHAVLSEPDGPGASTVAKCYRLLR